MIIEDHEDVIDMLSEVLTKKGYDVTMCLTGIDGLHTIRENKFDCILLDIMLPFVSGDEILKEIRKISNVPVIITSAKDHVSTKIDLFKIGADDYITKPFDLGELLARVEVNLRRTGKLHTVIQHKGLTLDETYKNVTYQGKPIPLTAKEYQILSILLKNKDKVFTKAKLYELLWDEAYAGDDNTIKTHISNLRTKLKAMNEQEEYIETIRGLGYRLHR